MSTPPTSGRRVAFRWPPASAAALERPRDLALLLAEPAADRAASGRELVVEASRVVAGWLRAAPPEWAPRVLAAELERGLAPFVAAHGWRGVVAGWLDTLRAAFRAAASHPALASELAGEVGLFVWSGGAEPLELEPVRGPWCGTPFASGRRLVDLESTASALARGLERGSFVLVPAHDELIARALEEAQRGGREPKVIVGQGGADDSGKRLARRLARAGIAVRIVYDAALVDRLPWADVVWTGVEAVGASGFVARVGVAALCTQARAEGVPCCALATSDDLVPGGELILPAWSASEHWLLWEDAPAGVEVESQLFERVAHEAVDGYCTEVGRESPAAFAVRGMRTTAQQPLTASLLTDVPRST